MRPVALGEHAQRPALDAQARRVQPVPGLTDHRQRALAAHRHLAAGVDGRAVRLHIAGAAQVADGTAVFGQRQNYVPARGQRRGGGAGQLRPVPDQLHIVRVHKDAALAHRSGEAVTAALRDGDGAAVHLHARAGLNARVGKYDLRLRKRRAAKEQQAQRAQRRDVFSHIHTPPWIVLDTLILAPGFGQIVNRP